MIMKCLYIKGWVDVGGVSLLLECLDQFVSQPCGHVNNDNIGFIIYRIHLKDNTCFLP